MQHCDYFNAVFVGGEIDGIGESLEQAAPDSGFDFRELKRIESGARQDVIDFVEKANPQTGFLVLVPACRVGDIKLGLWPEQESPHEA